MSQKEPLNGFKWVEVTSQGRFHKKTIMKIVIQDIFLKLMLNIQNNSMNFIMIYLFY